MPWTTKDVDRHKKGLTDEQKKTWVKVANSALKRCLSKGGSQDECEGSAIRQASSVVGQQKESDMYRGYFTSGSATVEVRAIEVGDEAVPVGELVDAYREQRGQGQGQGGPRQGDGGADMCVCPECGHEVEHEKGTPCNETECPECGAKMVGQSEASESASLGEATWTTAYVNDLPDSSFAVVLPGGEKDEEGKTKPRSLRKLPYKDKEGNVDVPHLRNALARLAQPKTDIPAGLKSKALKKLQSMAKKHLKTYQKEMQAIDLAVSLVESFEVELDGEMAEIELCESAAGHAINLAEIDTSIGVDSRAPLLLDFALLKPGRGNKKDNHYYPREVLERDVHVFEGVKMYATDHRPEEKSVRTEVGIVKTCPLRFEEDGTPIGRASIFNPDFAEQVRNRAKAGVLDSLENSILGVGKTKKEKAPDGEIANIVEAITKGISVDFVTKGGAGGQARALIENDAGGANMLEKEKVEGLLSESDLPQEAQERLAGAEYENEEAVKEAILKEKAQEREAPQTLAEAEVEKTVSESKLPEFAKAALKVRTYKDEAELKEAIEGAVKEVAKLTGSGQPFGQGGSDPPTAMSEADYDAAYNNIMKRHGLNVPEEARNA